jgi:hypothetical protein
MRRGVTDREYVLDRISVDDNGCWLWTGYTDGDGYSLFVRGTAHLGTRRQGAAHRLAYEAFVGPIPERHEIDHSCRVRRCVNPEHLRAVTHAVNMGAIPKRTHCRAGHAYTPENTYWFPSRHTYRCRQCHREKNLAWMRAKRAEK